MEWYLKVLRNFGDFTGRSRRKEYWMFVLFNVIFAFIAMFLDNMLGLGFGAYGVGPLYCLYALMILVPGIAVAVRRLHDTDKSGWWILIAFVPFIGGIILLVFMVMEGTIGDNQYGPDPKAETFETV